MEIEKSSKLLVSRDAQDKVDMLKPQAQYRGSAGSDDSINSLSDVVGTPPIDENELESFGATYEHRKLMNVTKADAIVVGI